MLSQAVATVALINVQFPNSVRLILIRCIPPSVCLLLLLLDLLERAEMALAQRLGRTSARHPVQCRVVAGLRRCCGRVSSVPAAATISAQKRTLTRVNVALVS